MANTYPSTGEHVPPIFTVSASADKLPYAAGSGLPEAVIALMVKRNETLTQIRAELAHTPSADFDGPMVALVYSIASAAIRWEEEYQGFQAAHVSLPGELDAEPGSFAGVAMRSIEDGSVWVFSYTEWSQRSDGHEVPGILVRAGHANLE